MGAELHPAGEDPAELPLPGQSGGSAGAPPPEGFLRPLRRQRPEAPDRLPGPHAAPVRGVGGGAAAPPRHQGAPGGLERPGRRLQPRRPPGALLLLVQLRPRL